MDFDLSAEQQQFAASLHDMLGTADGPAAARSWAAGDRNPGLEIWRALADAGVTGLMVAPDHGGLDASPADLVIACEEIGHHAVPGPVAESLAAVPRLLASLTAGPWLRALASGELIATLAAPPWLPLAADADVAGLVLIGETGSMIRKGLSPQSGQTRQDHEGVVRLAAVGQTHRSVHAARTLAEVTAGEVIASSPEVACALAGALDFGALACAAQLLGAGRALLELAAVHARQRVQYGQPVGSFQAVKHQLADVLIGLEFARPLVFGAAISLGSDSGDARRDVSAAKVACTQAASRAARTALQVLGATGYTAEHDVSLYLTKVRALAGSWGSQAQHRARVLAALTSAQPTAGG
jgi:alkylation response protein AidB-like acyl-CoA dehydrogenase